MVCAIICRIAGGVNCKEPGTISLGLELEHGRSEVLPGLAQVRVMSLL